MPSAQHHGLVLLLHMASHLTASGIGLRHLCDWLVFIESFSDEEFVKEFKSSLTRCGLWKFAETLTQIGVYYFGCKPKAWCNQSELALCKELLDDIIASGNFGNKKKERTIQAKFIRSNESRRVDGSSFISLAIKNINYKCHERFKITRKFPILLPGAWCCLLLEYMLKGFNGKKITINKRILKDASKRKKTYAKLELFKMKDPC